MTRLWPETTKDKVREVDGFDYGYASYGGYEDSPGAWPRVPADDRQAFGYPPAGAGVDYGHPARGVPRPQASPPGTGQRPPYRWPMPDYRSDTGSRPAYRPDGEPAPGRRRRGGPPADGGYPATDGYRQTRTALLAGSPLISGPPPISGPMPAYRSPRDATSTGPLLPGGKRVPGWLPFSDRLILLPKGLPFDGDEELREHRDVNGGWLRPAVFGAMDGLVTNSSLIAGIGGGGAGHGMIVLTGVAGLIAGAFSMATGEYISVKAQNELTAAEVELERKQHARDPAAKRTRLTELYMEKGVSPNLAEAVVRQISADEDRAVAEHVREELGIDPDDLPSPQTAAVASFASFTVGALIPLSPFLIGYPVLSVALTLAGASAFAGGAAVANLTGRSPWLGGLRQFTAAFLATGMAFLIGHLVGAHVG
jgi:vacuolar iron transporter family protein